MEFIDDDVDVSGEDEVLVPSSQAQTQSSQSVRPSKRRRLNKFSNLAEDSDSVSDDYDLPSNEIPSEDDDFDNPRTKYDAVIHVPAYAESQKNQFVTQVDQPWSSPTAIRGPRWRKKDAAASSEPDSPLKPIPNKSTRAPVDSASRVLHPPNPIVVDEFDDEDIEAIMAGQANESFDDMQSVIPRAHTQQKTFRQTTLFGVNTTQRNVFPSTQSRAHSWPMASRNEPLTHHNIDKTAMQTWIYPLNIGVIRDYQFNIVHRALFHNLLVALPTGLGKTFIAATVMLNYFNWTKDAQIVFVAPTKPLVSQQVNACFHIAGIPRSQTTLLTGEIQPAIRAEEWREKRVFFMTPQTLINDLKTGLADPKKIVLLVVDEAHKATGNYAYVEVVRFLRRFNSSFRVLALTATPGATVEAVQKVIDGLGIARVEIRTEESIDIRNFVHSRHENIELLDNTEDIELCLDLVATAVKPVLTKVNSLNAYFSNDPKTMTLYGLRMGQEQWLKSDAGRNANWGLKNMVRYCFQPLMSIAHALQLLRFHGIGPFYHKMRSFDDEDGGGKQTKEIKDSESYKKLMRTVKAWINDDNFVGHPKLTYLNEVVLNHFMDAGDGLGGAGGRPPSDTRIMVFTSFRDSAEEIARILNRHQPMVRAHVFVGQSGTKDSEGMDQKTQMDIIQKFKSGTYNTLVATSIGEEGLDIGQVDLIVCYDTSKSPIRMLQRMGRTGRKRAGNVVLLLMRGKEERDYHAAKDNYLKMQSIIESGKDFQFHDDVSPRIVPREIQPMVDKRHVEIPFENTQAGSPEPRKRRAKNNKRPPKKFHMPDNVETGFHFLGNSKKDKVNGRDKPIPRPEVDTDEAILPHLSSVLLSEKDEVDLERRYGQITGDETEYVQAVRLDAFPDIIRQAGKTKFVKHSIATQSLIKASRAMHNEDRGWDRPRRSSIIEEDQVGSQNVTEALPQHAAHGSLLGDVLSSPENPHVPPAEISDSDSSANGDDNKQAKRRATGDCLVESLDMCDEDERNVIDKPFYISQQSLRDQDSEADDLPPMNQLFTTKKPVASRTTASRSRRDGTQNKAQRNRRILVDDSDE